MTLQEIQQLIRNKLKDIYESIELNSLVNILIEDTTGWDKIHQNMHKNEVLGEDKINLLNQYTEELMQGRPIQYILNKAWFLNKELKVNEHVLIPRPETEELVEWVIEYASIIHEPLDIVDIGTGSGCIAISLATALPDCKISAIDISETALEVAKMNAEKHHANIEWQCLDILQSKKMPRKYDVIVSNPPYIPMREKENMQKQVTDHEPSIALFVGDQYPLIFYSKIAKLGKDSLNANGQLFFEIHYDQGEAIVHLLDEMGYHAELRQDMYGKDRMVRASLK